MRVNSVSEYSRLYLYLLINNSKTKHSFAATHQPNHLHQNQMMQTHNAFHLSQLRAHTPDRTTLSPQQPPPSTYLFTVFLSIHTPSIAASRQLKSWLGGRLCSCCRFVCKCFLYLHRQLMSCLLWMFQLCFDTV